MTDPSRFAAALTVACFLGGASAQTCGEEPFPSITPASAGFGAYLDMIGENVAVGYADYDEVFLYVISPDSGNWVPWIALSVFGTPAESVAIASAPGDLLITAVGLPSTPAAPAGATGGVELTQSTVDPVTLAILDPVSPPTGIGYPIEEFGRSVDLSDDGRWLLVGAPGTLADAGCAFVYERTPSGYEFRHDVFLGTAPDRFGAAVAIEGTSVIVGSPGYDGAAGVDSGAVWFYSLDESTGLLSLVTSDEGGAPGDALGTTVAIDQGTGGIVAASGSPTASPAGADGGIVRAYLDGALIGGFFQFAGERLGASVAVTGDTVLAGRPGGVSGGTVDRYRVNGASLEYVETILPSASQVGAEFGAAVAADAGAFVVGDPGYAQDGFADKGLVRFYGGFGFDIVDLGNGLAGFLGITPSLTSTICFVDGEAFTLTLSGARPGAQAGLFVGVQSPAYAPFKGGVLVPQPDFLVTVSTGPAGVLPLTATWPLGLTTGLDFQYWIQDADGPVGFAASNAIRLALSP